jgi:hypothetical protein
MMEAAYPSLDDPPSINMLTVGTALESFLGTTALANCPRAATGPAGWNALRKSVLAPATSARWKAMMGDGVV